MGYNDDRERRRMNREDEYRRGDFDRFSRGYRTTGWPGESSWGYGREYDERFPPRYERPYEEVSETFSPSERFEDSGRPDRTGGATERSEEHTSELQSRRDLVCRLLLEKKKK